MSQVQPSGPPDGSYLPAWLELQGVVNMRDLGGLPTIDGGTTLPGRLIRSDNLQDLAPASVRHLVDDLGVTDVVDLRTFVEVAKEGDGPMLAERRVTVHHYTLYPENSTQSGIPAGERELPWARKRPDGRPARRDPAKTPDHDAFWSTHYLGYLAQRPDSIVSALRSISRSEGAVVVHCAAGKDRTGTVTGLALKVAGVTTESVLADYAASAERVPLILERLRSRPAYSEDLVGKTVDEQSPRANTMARVLAALEERYGGVEAWLEEQGWTAQDSALLRAKLRG